MKFIDAYKTTKSPTILLTHGASQGAHSDFMVQITDQLRMHKLQVLRLNFAYMNTIEQTGKKRPPGRIDKLCDEFSEQLSELPNRVWIGGKSMGGRVASLVANHPNVMGVVALGYPFHPPGKPEKLRTEHLASFTKPMLILQGTRDPFGKPQEVKSYTLSEHIKVHWLEDGDHSFQSLKRSQYTSTELIAQAAQEAVAFIQSQTPKQ